MIRFSSELQDLAVSCKGYYSYRAGKRAYVVLDEKVTRTVRSDECVASLIKARDRRNTSGQSWSLNNVP